MAWGAVAAAGISALGSLLASRAGSGMQFGLNKELISHQSKTNYKYAEKYAKEGPSWNRLGLESAGYNPMLAVQNATSGANSSWASGSSVSAPDFSGAVSSGVANAQSFQKLLNETKIAEATSQNQYQQSLTEESKRKNYEFDSMMKDAQRHMIDKETSWIDKKKNAEIYKDMQDAERARAEASIVAYNAESARIVSNAQKLQAETSSKWTPVGIGAGLGAGLLGFGLSKVPGLKYLKKAKVGF